MIELNLTAENRQEELVKAYLEEHASEELAEKINNGTLFTKDGVPLTNKKTLADFMKYACEEARKLAQKGANSACVEDAVVFGWAIHYFEEDSIEGTLYTLDGAEYKPASKMVSKPASKPVEKAPVKKAPEEPNKDQFSFFNLSKPVETEEEQIEDEEEKEPEEEAAPIVEKPFDETTGEVLVDEEELAKQLSSVPEENVSDLEKYFDPECLLRISELLDGQIVMR